MIYKFRMLLEGNDHFMREYELRATDHFESFHQLIHDTVKFQAHELASFFICDGEWNRTKEITLLDMRDEAQEEESQEQILVMKDALLRDYMEEPRQRLIYEYDFLRPKTFYIELSGIGKDLSGTEYPRCIYSRGDIEVATPAVDPESEFDDLLEDEDLEGNDNLDLDGLEDFLNDMGGDVTIEGPEEE